jgi:hypothetical protein
MGREPCRGPAGSTGHGGERHRQRHGDHHAPAG